MSAHHDDANQLLAARQRTHGEFTQNAIYAQHLRGLYRSSPQWSNMPVVQQEALDMIATKFSRILSGQWQFGEHWDDVIGYATLARKACQE